MYKNILIPLDGSPLAEMAIPHARSLLSPDAPTVTLVRNARTDDAVAKASLDRVAAQLCDTPVNTVVIQGNVAQSIINSAEACHADLIAMSTHGLSGIKRLALGSVAERVLHLAQRPVLLVQAFVPEDPAITRILLPVDGSELSRMALPHAYAIAKQTGAPLVLLLVLEQYNVWEWGEFMRRSKLTQTAGSDIIAAAERYLQQLRATMPDIACDVQLAPARPVDAITSAVAEQKFDLIVMSTHGRSGYKRWRYGSTADALLHSVKVPLLLIRGTDPGES